MNNSRTGLVWGVLRLLLGWVFLWAFLDKLFGLGFSTTTDKSWLSGGSPTTGFLAHATKGPFMDFFQGLAGNILVDWLFMAGLLFAGITLILGISVRLGASVGFLLVTGMYLAGSIWPENNPFVDEHVVYAAVMIGLIVSDAGMCLGLGAWWQRQKLVQAIPLLK
jgi:thiosulfate dehydrogenase [quinone] large subunit